LNPRASPLGLPYTLSRPSTRLRATLRFSKGRAPLRRRAPFAWRTRCRSFAPTQPIDGRAGLRRLNRRRSSVAIRVRVVPCFSVAVHLTAWVPWQNSGGMKTKSRFLRAPVEPFVVEPDAAAGDLLARMERISFQGRNLATARRIWEKMLGGDCTIFLGMAGALRAPGLPGVLADPLR